VFEDQVGDRGQVMNAKRYYRLEKNYPGFLQRFPQHFIASYLGIILLTFITGI